jgi:hypothetical protein
MGPLFCIAAAVPIVNLPNANKMNVTAAAWFDMYCAAVRSWLHDPSVRTRFLRAACLALVLIAVSFLAAGESGQRAADHGHGGLGAGLHWHRLVQPSQSGAFLLNLIMCSVL